MCSVINITAYNCLVMITLSILWQLAFILDGLVCFEIRSIGLVRQNISAMALVVYDIAYP